MFYRQLCCAANGRPGARLFRPQSLWRGRGFVLACLTGWAIAEIAGSPLLAASTQSLGDFDADGRPTVLDLVRLIDHLNGTAPLPFELLRFADVNQDGAINSADVAALADAIL